MEEAITAQSV